MRTSEMVSTAPIAVQKSIRGDELRSLTSTQGGVIVPLAYIPMLREDGVRRGDVRLAFDMKETIHPLLNSVNVTGYAHFISHAAMPRFAGMDSFNRSYQGQPEAHDDTVIPFFQQIPFDASAEIWKTLGVHWKDGADINQMPIEAYNFLVNWRRSARSDKLPQRTVLDTTLAEAFWKNTNMAHVVPDFDQAAMDGEVPLTIVNPEMPVRGIGLKNSANPDSGTIAMKQTWGGNYGGDGFYAVEGSPATSQHNIGIAEDPSRPGFPNIFAEMQSEGVVISLANIELAKQTAAFAKLRDKYHALDDDHIVDLLMEGIRVPDEQMKQPILLDRKSGIFGYNERQAMDGENLDVSRTTGRTELNLKFRTPAMNTGGIILITAEIVPEQLYERQYDTYLGTAVPDSLPNFMRDYLDPEKVEIVENQYVDVEHSNPTALFGYAPLNHSWKRSLTRAGNKFYRPTPDAFVEDRQRFWSVDTTDPTLNDDFYLVTDLPHTVFADAISDNFEILTLGTVSIVGNTVFGSGLQEDENSYEQILDQVDTDRIDQDNPPT